MFFQIIRTDTLWVTAISDYVWLYQCFMKYVLQWTKRLVQSPRQNREHTHLQSAFIVSKSSQITVQRTFNKGKGCCWTDSEFLWHLASLQLFETTLLFIWQFALLWLVRVGKMFLFLLVHLITIKRFVFHS